MGKGGAAGVESAIEEGEGASRRMRVIDRCAKDKAVSLGGEVEKLVNGIVVKDAVTIEVGASIAGDAITIRAGTELEDLSIDAFGLECLRYLL